MSTAEFESIAYYPNETPLYEGELNMTEFKVDPDSGLPSAYVQVDGQAANYFVITRESEEPLRTQYTASFLKRVGRPLVCNVDLELPKQPSNETVARALLAAMNPENESLKD